MIAALALTPMRDSNFRRLEIGRSFVLAQGGYHVHLRAEETKSGRPFEAAVADQLVPHFHRYLSAHRLLLLAKGGTPHHFLWVNDWGTAYTFGNLGARISRLTKKMLGVPVHPHLFRDSAATTIFRNTPHKRVQSAVSSAMPHRAPPTGTIFRPRR